MRSVLIIGAGQFGSHVARTMSELRCEIMAIDIDEQSVNNIMPYVTNAQIGDATNAEFLRSLGVSDYDVCIVSIGDNFQSSLEITALLKELGASEVISRASNDVQEKFLLRNGADEVVYPEKQSARRLAIKLSSDAILDFIELDSDHSIYEMAMPRDWIGKSLVQLDVRRKHNVNIISLKRNGKLILPGADTVMSDGDVLYVIGDMKDLRKCFRI
ncbi:MAG: TrkA family potassium uptake protein [Clostridia bacterium]|nr:TrkA family potassium uptake protein [Clostridia bacterium]